MLNAVKSALGGNKKFLIPTLGLSALIGVGVLGISAVQADDAEGLPPFLQGFVERFNLNDEEVKTYFEEQKQDKLKLMQQTKDERLNQAVSDGVITEEQKQAFLDKWGEKKAHREQHRAEMQTWFEEQGIDVQALHDYGGFGHKGFGFRHWGK